MEQIVPELKIILKKNIQNFYNTKSLLNSKSVG